MNQSALTIAYPWWSLGICLLIGLAYAALLYYKSRDAELWERYPWLKRTVIVVRAALVSLLAFLLLTPLLNSTEFSRHKPVIRIAVDNSLSVQHREGDSLKLQEALLQLEQDLTDKFDIEWQTLKGDKMLRSELELNQQETNLSAPLNDVLYEPESVRPAAILLISDGIYNRGRDPVLSSRQLPIAVHSLALGDSAVLRDQAIADVRVNPIAYLGNSMRVQLALKADGWAGRTNTLTVLHNGQEVHSKTIRYRNDASFLELEIDMEATVLGLNAIRMSLPAFAQETNASNNYYTAYVEVIDAKKKVEIWSRYTHPDLGALGDMIDRMDQYEVELKKRNFVAGDQDLVILYDWFENGSDLSLFENLKTKGIACLSVFGAHFNPAVYNSSSSQLRFESRGSGTQAATANANQGFDYFDMDAAVLGRLESFPPLNAPFGKLTGASETDVLLHQQIGQVTTTEPLVVLKDEGGHRSGVIAGSGFWRWRLSDARMHGNWDACGGLIEAMTQFLTVKDAASRFKVKAIKRQFAQSDPVVLKGELLNKSMQRISTAEVLVKVLSENKEVVERAMNPDGSTYSLDLGQLPAGEYSYYAAANLEGEELKSQGFFIVDSSQLELVDLRARPEVLRAISALSGGVSIPVERAEELIAILKADSKYTTSIKEKTRWLEFIELPWLFGLLVVLLSFEWFMRKYIGAY